MTAIAVIVCIAIALVLFHMYNKRTLLKNLAKAVEMIKIGSVARLHRKLSSQYGDAKAMSLSVALTNELFSELSHNAEGDNFLAQNKSMVERELGARAISRAPSQFTVDVGLVLRAGRVDGDPPRFARHLSSQEIGNPASRLRHAMRILSHILRRCRSLPQRHMNDRLSPMVEEVKASMYASALANLLFMSARRLDKYFDLHDGTLFRVSEVLIETSSKL